MSDHRYRNKHRSLWPPRRVNTRLSASQGTYYDETLPHPYNGNPSVVASSAAMDIPPDTVIVHVPGVTSARTSTSDGHNDSSRLMQLSHTPPLPVNQAARGDMPSDARPSSDEDEGYSGARGSPFVGPHAASEPARTSGLHSRSVQSGPICTTPGLCQAGGELRLSHLSGKTVRASEGFVLVGAKSPMLPGMMLVAEVDRRFLPDEKNNVTMLGFSGNCIGCGAKGFRYFTEFSSHINLKLATQPKKQKHLKYYIVCESSGRIRKGPAIPWKVEGRKRTFPMTVPYISPSYSPGDIDVKKDVAAPIHLLSLQSRSSSMQGPSAAESPRDDSRLVMHPMKQSPAEQSYNSGLAAKRRRWESTGSESPMGSDDGHSSDTGRSVTGSDTGELPSEPWLTTACGVRPVLLLCQHSIPKTSCSMEDIIISDLLVGCFDPPLVSDHSQFGSMISGVYSSVAAGAPDSHEKQARSFYGNVPCLTTQMAVLLTVQYLTQFVDDDRIIREDIEQLLQDARLELTATVQQQVHVLAQSNAVMHVQLPVLASLTAANSKGRVKIVSSPVSLDNAIFRALKFVWEIHRHNQSKFPKVPVPDFIFVLATSTKKSPEFCLLVTSILQAKYLSEAMIGHPVGARIADNLSRLEHLFKLSSDALEQMINNFEEAMGQGQLVFVPFNGFARTKVMVDEAARLEPRVPAAVFHPQNQALFASQHLMAKHLLNQVCTISENINSLDLNNFTAVSTTIIVPPLTTIFNQTAQRLCSSGLLFELDLETADKAVLFKTAAKYVIKHSGVEETQDQLLKLLEQVHSKPEVLFVVVFDQAQFFASPHGILDFPYYNEFLEAHNVLVLYVTATPYLFQTNCSFIDPNNEVYWTDVRSEADGVSLSVVENSSDNLETNEGTYFGMKEYCESIKWTHQFPLVRQDDAFEKMALRTSRTTDDVNLSVLRCYLLIRHYCAAIMWSAGIKPAEPHCTLKTIQIMREIIESPVHNADGSGAMLVIRIPSVELANLAFESLKNTRDRLGFQFRFAIIHDNGVSELEIEEYFLKRLRLWREQRGLTKAKSKSAERWNPKCFEDLHDLPCIIIVSGRERPGDTFPRSLKYIDLRLIDRGFVYRSSLELEFSAIACYIGSGTGSRGIESSEPTSQAGTESKDESNANNETVCRTSRYSSAYPLPVILVSRSVFKAFQCDFYGYPKHLLLPTTPQTRWVGLGRPPVVTSNPRHQSLYYREWTEPKPKQVPGPQQDASRQPVITLRSASGVVISPDIADVVEEDGMSAVESFAESNRMASAGASEGEDSNCEDSKSAIENGATKKTRNSELTEKHQPVIGPVLHRVYDMAASTWQDTSAGETGSDNSRNEPQKPGADKYHPRSILFSGPPQVGKTHSYLHFIRLLHQTVQKLRRVDVYNESLSNPDESTALGTPDPSGDDHERMVWPVYSKITKLPFTCLLQEHRYASTSKLRIHPSAGNACFGDVPTQPPSVKRSPRRPTCSMMLSYWAAYDTYHHCDGCKSYRESRGPSTPLSYAYTLQGGERLRFLIPHRFLQSFTFTKEKQLRSLRLPVVLTGGSGEAVKLLKVESAGDGELIGSVKSPIIVPSTGRHDYGLLNLYHAMEGENHTLLVFVKHQEMALYHKAWPNHVIVGLPASADNQGLGAARYYIKEFATENWHAERERQGVHGKRGQDVWPFIFMMDDSCVMWQNLLKQAVNREESSSKETEGPSCVMTSLLKVLQHLESTPDLMSFGMLGVQDYSTDSSSPVSQGSFTHGLLHTAVMMNLDKLQGIKYNKHRYWWEDVNFSLKVLANGIHTCRFNHLVVAKKFIEFGGATTFKEEPAASAEGSSNIHNKDLLPGDNMVTAPDREGTPYLAAPAYYLLERYLELMGAAKLFPVTEARPQHPVLVVDCYVNLGPKLTVEFVSSSGREKGGRDSDVKSNTSYGGLLLYFCDRSVSKQFLAQFKFAPGSRLCLVCQDRNTLRQEVARLDLEEHWRFRLRDELQTANSPDEPALYFLTGKHDD